MPAAIGMRGNVFGALGSRLGTAVHTGTFRMSARRDTLVQQMSASESLAAVDTICVDKTGTLTESTVILRSALDAAGVGRLARAAEEAGADAVPARVAGGRPAPCAARGR